METAHLFWQIEGLPDTLKAQVADYVTFLIHRHKPEKKIKERQYGDLKGMIKMAPDFDEPLEDFKDYM